MQRSDPGTRGRAGLGRGGGGKEGEGGSGRRLGTEEKVLNPVLGSAPPSPLRTLRSNQEEQEEEEDEQNGRHHQPGRKRGRAQARPARSLLRPAATACPAKVAKETESPAKEYTLRLDTTEHVVAVGLLAGQDLSSSKRDPTQREKPRNQVSGNCGPGKVGGKHFSSGLLGTVVQGRSCACRSAKERFLGSVVVREDVPRLSSRRAGIERGIKGGRPK